MARNTKKSSENRSIIKPLLWVVLSGLSVLAILSLVSYDPADWPSHAVVPHNASPANWCGRVGAAFAHEAYLMFGQGAWVLVAGAVALLAFAAAGRRIGQLPIRIIGIVLMALAASGLWAMIAPKSGEMPEGSGGLIAIFMVEELAARFSHPGTIVVMLVALAVGATLAADRLVVAAPGAMVAALRKLRHMPKPTPALVGWPRLNTPRDERPKSPANGGKQRSTAVDDEEPIDEDAGGLGATESFDPDEYRRGGQAEDEEEIEEDEYEDEEDEDESATDAPSAYMEDKSGGGMDPEALKEKIQQLPISFASKHQPGKPLPTPQQDLSGYQFPGLDLLADPESNFNEEMEKLVRDQAEVLETALHTYRIDAEVVAIDSGPVITLYEVALAPGTKVSQINAISSDVARELKAQSIRIVPNTAGKSTVGIEVPNLKKEKVRLKELMSLGGQQVIDNMKLPMFLGKDASGNPLIADLATMPHMLIAGTTGSGKSVCMNSVIMSWLLTRKPDEVKFVLVDPKMVEMSQFKNVPHLMCPVVTDMGKAAAILEWAVSKMDERYELLAEAGVRDIDAYNSLDWEELKERFEPQSEDEEARIPRKMPRLVFIIDELADLIMTHKEVEGFIVRIAQKARAVGIHLILATQRPQANVVTGLIKSNMPCRVGFKVASGMDSRIVLDQKGAELLLGQGDMLYLSPRSSELTRAQGTLVDDVEIRRTTKFLKDVAEQSFEPQLVQLKGADARDVDDEAATDPLFEDAVGVVLETKRGSVSLLQRRLTIGYSRASRLIEAMAAAGILGDHKGSQAREVQITVEEWEAMKAQLAADWSDAAQSNAAEDDALGDASWDEDDEDA